MSSCVFSSPPDQAPHLRDTGFVPLGVADYWVAIDELRHERDFIAALRFFQSAPSPLVFAEDWLTTRKQEFIDKEKGRLDAVELSEQFTAVFGMLDRGHAISLITGPPGAAKSTIASLWTRVARARFPDLPLVLITQEKPALQRLKEKINASGAVVLTVDEALADDTTWPHHAAVIIDEAGLFCTRIMAALLSRARAAMAVKIMLIGDDRQLNSDAPGQPFRWLCRNDAADIVVLSNPFRQKSPELRQAVSHLYQGDVTAAWPHIPCRYVASEAFLRTIRAEMAQAVPDKCFVIVHGPELLMERLRVTCPGFRIFSLAAAQGLAIDRVILVIGSPINCAELLVGCSRQRFALDVFVEADIYANRPALVAGVAPYPQNLMVLDVLGVEKTLDIFDQAQVLGRSNDTV